MKSPRRGREGGFSLVELAVSLAIVGVVGLALWRFIPLARQISQGSALKDELAQAQAATEGFVLRAHRLPCPDTDNDGHENCAAGALGTLPWRDLGLGATQGALRYGVYRAGGHDLAASALTHQAPLLPIGYTVSTTANGLDFCTKLRGAITTPGAAGALTAGNVEVAYALAHPGADGQFQGLNTLGFDLPGRARDNTYDDSVVAAGLSELSGRMACPSRLGEATVAARAAMAAYDIDRDAKQFQEFRDFASQVRTTNKNFAAANVGLTILDLLDATATTASSVSIAANSVGVGAATVVVAVAAMLAAIASQVSADASLAMAIIGELKAQAQATGAAQIKAQTAAALIHAGNNAVAVDNKGLTP
ncbi:MAG: type II secretion system protein [Rhodoferax sp.]|uniref:type II secretion system protein n=1 Tax=Rhodoferax sp. TaxID=50421 RepID=UPI0026017F43|nr:type II secretion system protein [Rhodoferax sp.]MDD5333142.1 type II secretion system protein [Rhodoferax sp.]